MSDQAFCDYCGADTRDEHKDNCPAPALSDLRERVEALERWAEEHSRAERRPMGISPP